MVSYFQLVVTRFRVPVLRRLQLFGAENASPRVSFTDEALATNRWVDKAIKTFSSGSRVSLSLSLCH